MKIGKTSNVYNIIATTFSYCSFLSPYNWTIPIFVGKQCYSDRRGGGGGKKSKSVTITDVDLNTLHL